LADRALVITGGAKATVSVKVAWPVPPVLVALSVTAEVPAVAGVPEINPAALTDKPEGNPAAPRLVGELEAVIW
jgi:hypothetical protein